jgi:hypothetical protein
MSTNIYRVTPPQANLRSTPKMDTKNVLAVLPQGQLVTLLGSEGNWRRVSTQLQRSLIEGYIFHNLIERVDGEEYVLDHPIVLPNIPEAHLAKSAAGRRSSEQGRAFPLSEANQPGRNSLEPAKRAEELLKIVNWLQVEKSERYAPKSSKTYCNIYAYDYCFLAGVYLPRVWWMQKALTLLAKGEKVTVQYAKTVAEINANGLFNWLEEFGDDFGWRRTFSLDELQQAANGGQVSIICAQRKDLNASGHICAVVPENGNAKATRKNNLVAVPLQSQAGVTNFRFGGRPWWLSDKFRSYGFWIHA